MAPNDTPRWLVYSGLAAVVVLWGLNSVVMKAAFAHWDPLGFTALRFLAMAPLAIGLAKVCGESLRIDPRDLPAFLVVAACGFGAYQYFYVIGLSHTTAFASSLLSTLAPIFTLLLGVAMGAERSRSGRWIGAAIALLGVAVFEGAFAGQAIIRLGDALTLVAAAIFSGYNIIAARLLSRYTPTALVAITLALGAAMIVPGGLWGAIHQDFTRITATDWLLMAFSIVFPIIIGYQLWSWGIAKLGPGPTSLFNFAVPVVAGFAGVLFLHMPLKPYEIAGAAICLGGLAASQYLTRFSLTTLWTRMLLSER